MGCWPEDGRTRDEVVARLAEGMAWRIEWCSGARSPDTCGVGPTLPPGVLDLVPTPARRRSIDRKGLHTGRTWMLVVEREEDGRPILLFDEGPEHRHV